MKARDRLYVRYRQRVWRGSTPVDLGEATCVGTRTAIVSVSITAAVLVLMLLGALFP